MSNECALTKEELYVVGINHRGLVITFSVGFLLRIGALWQPNNAVLILAGIFSIVCLTFLNIFAWKMISGMKKTPIPFLVITIATLIFVILGYPVANFVWIVMFAIYHDKAIKILKSAGVQVSLLGATSNALKELKKQ